MTTTDEAWVARPPRRGVGWLSFAAALLVLSGLFKITDALWAFKYDDEVSEEVQTVLFENDLASWGWLWLALGVALVAAGFAVASGSEFARWFGIVAAGLSGILNYAWIFVQPIWALLSVTLAILVIYALAAYGGHKLREPVVDA